MGKYYLFGAGINGYAVIQFLGVHNIIAVIDNDVRKQGGSIEGIPIISLQQYIDRNDRRAIMITGFYDSISIIRNLEENGIRNYYISPYMQNGFYENVQDIINKLKLYKFSKICFCSENPISECMEHELKMKYANLSVSYMDSNCMEEISADTPIIITNADDRRRLDCIDKSKKILFDLNEIYEKNFGYQNKKIRNIKNIHKGKRCFIIGNGPSLKYEDLECLYRQNEICFGVNRIYLSYPNTVWRPDYYVAVDYVLVQKDCKKILELEGTKFIRHSYKFIEKWDRDDIYEFRGLAYPPGMPQISFDMYQGVYMGNTVVYDAIQIAYYMGFQEIYLLGVDMTSGIRSEDDGAHFYKSPDTKEILGMNGKVELAKKCLGYAAQEIEKTGRKLRNATRGGELENVERVAFDSLFER